jgi:hypothetical protein
MRFLIFVTFAVAIQHGSANEEWTRAQAPMDSPFYRDVLRKMFPEWFAEMEMKQHEIEGAF